MMLIEFAALSENPQFHPPAGVPAPVAFKGTGQKLAAKTAPIPPRRIPVKRHSCKTCLGKCCVGRCQF